MGIYIDIKKNLSGFRFAVKLSSQQDDIIGILGASGAGKSMLLNCIAGLVNPDEGIIRLNDKIFYDSAQGINLAPKDRKIGFLFQNYALFPHLTIAENIAFGLDGLSKAGRNKKVTELMERFRIAEMGKRYPSQISGGQQQRVALARALAAEPDILLLDEPFSALDNHLKNNLLKEMLVSLREYKRNTMFVTHNIEEAYRLCNRIAILSAGSVDIFGEKDLIFERPVSLAVARITGCKNIVAAFRNSANIIEVPDWGIQVKTSMEIVNDKGFAGIRANHVKLADDNAEENCFLAWIADESEAQFRTSLYLKIGSEPHNPDDYHIQWEISKEQRESLRNFPQPIKIYLDPEHIFFVNK